jgi:stage III sporulation protein SpoIIIAA
MTENQIPTLPLSLPPVPEVGASTASVGANQLRVTDNLSQLLAVIPQDIRQALLNLESLDGLIEIVLDLGRDAEARFPNGGVHWLRVGTPVSLEDITYVVSRVGAFAKDNRAGIERSLHRISAIRNRQGVIIGLTCRIGRAVYGTIDLIRDIVESGKSILLLGKPGRGKTTKLREVARVLSEEFAKRVIIVDTSNEIAGDGDIPHPAIGRARRMQVAAPELQHAVMIEAVENHMPEVIVIDEIGVEAEAFAARTIAERGVQLIGTAHGNCLENLLMNPTLSDLIGGIQPVTLSDEEAKKRGTQKTVLERKAPPTFDVIIEIMEVDKLAIHHDVTQTVDRMLRGGQPRPEIRIRNTAGEIEVLQKSDLYARPTRMLEAEAQGGQYAHEPAQSQSPRVSVQYASAQRPEPAPATNGSSRNQNTQIGLNGVVRVFPYGISRSRLERALRTLRVPAFITKEIHDADVMIALKANYRKEPARLQEGLRQNIPTYVVKSNTYVQIENVLREVFHLSSPMSDEDSAIQEVEEAIEALLSEENTGLNSRELTSQNAYIRRLQHQIAEKHHLISESVGVEPNRRLRISRA